ncbi:MAG TPA: hypothetical protein VG457_03955, partial [Planctomycetota bacterium]|nr:hypothetical protein [Planctomycetota bacterium]
MKFTWTALLLVASGAAAWAHDEKFSSSRVDVKDDGVTWSVDVSMQGLEKVIALPTSPVELTERQFRMLQPDIIRYLQTCMTVKINGLEVQGVPLATDPLYETFVASGEKYIAHARQEFRYPSSSPVK